MKDVMEPYGRRTIGVGVLPGIPREIRLSLTCDEPPVVHGDVQALGNWEYRLKRAALGSRHVLGADERPAVALKHFRALLKLSGRLVVMK